jgi:TctA family transporter
MELISDRIRARDWFFLVLSIAGLVLSLVGIVIWRGEQQIDVEKFQLAFSLSILGTVIFGVLLIGAVLYLRREIKH